MDAITSTPAPRNEPVRSYAPQTPERESLIRRQLSSEASDSSQVVTEHHHLLHRRSPVENGKVLFSGCAQRDRGRQRSHHRATSAGRPERIADARDEAQLQRVGQVPPIDERAAATRVRKQLERRLAETVLEVLPAQLTAVGAQQHLALVAGHKRDLLNRVAWRSQRTSRAAFDDVRPARGGRDLTRPGRSAGSDVRPARGGRGLGGHRGGWPSTAASGRHIRMSMRTPIRPPSQSLAGGQHAHRAERGRRRARRSRR